MENEVKETARKRRVMTADDVVAVEAAIAKLNELGLEEKSLMVIEKLAVKWHGEDKEALAEAKAEVIESFGGSNEFKDFIESDFKAALAPYVGIVKLIPIVNNICSFYARRSSSSRKPKTIQVNIQGTLYNIDAEFYDSLNGKSVDEKRELLLSHPKTSVSKEVYEVL